RDALLRSRNERAARFEDVDIVRRADAFAALDANADARVVDVAFAGEQIAVPGVAFGGGKTTLAVHDADIVKFRYLDPLNQRAPARQRLKRTLEGLCDLLVKVVERDRGRHRQPHALDRARLQWLHGLIGEHGVERRATADGTRQRPEAVERGRQRHAAVERDA